MNRFKRTLTVLLALSLCISLMTGFAVPNAAATDWTERTV